MWAIFSSFLCVCAHDADLSIHFFFYSRFLCLFYLFILRLDLIILLQFFFSLCFICCFSFHIFIYLSEQFSVSCLDYFFCFFFTFTILVCSIQTKKCWNVDRIPCSFPWALIILSMHICFETTYASHTHSHKRKTWNRKPINRAEKSFICFI